MESLFTGLGLTFLVTAVVVLIVCKISIVVAAFRESILWGLGVLFVPFVVIVFVTIHWADVRRAFLGYVGSAAVLIGCAVLVPGFLQARTRSQHAQTSELTARIEDSRLEIEKLEGQFAAQGAEVIKLHQDLTQRRTSLKADDQVALAAFNADVAAYQSKNASQKALQEQLASKRTELEHLLADRAKYSATNAPAKSSRVIMYSTERCPACQMARSYFARKGVSYEERDIQTNAEARREFEQMGGRGVPLIIVGTERMTGFSEQQLDGLL